MCAEFAEIKTREERYVAMVKELLETSVTPDQIEVYARSLPDDAMKAQLFSLYDEPTKMWVVRMSEISPRDRELLREYIRKTQDPAFLELNVVDYELVIGALDFLGGDPKTPT